MIRILVAACGAAVPAMQLRAVARPLRKEIWRERLAEHGLFCPGPRELLFGHFLSWWVLLGAGVLAWRAIGWWLVLLPWPLMILASLLLWPVFVLFGLPNRQFRALLAVNVLAACLVTPMVIPW